MDTQKERLSTLHAQVTQHLQQGLIPYWLTRAWDDTYGGYLTNFDEHGQPLDTPEKYLNTQARLLWWFSTLYRRHPDLAQAGALAAKGFEFLLAHFWDTERGGWYWKVQRDGGRLDDGKVVYGESFAIYALSEYTLATGDAAQLVLHAEQRLHDVAESVALANVAVGLFAEDRHPERPPGEAAQLAGVEAMLR